MFTKHSPQQEDLAIHNGIWMGNYPTSILEGAHGWWALKERHLKQTVNTAGYNIARAIHAPFHQAAELIGAEAAKGTIYPEDMHFYIRELIRRKALGGLGLHMFMHCDGILTAGLAIERLEDPATATKANIHIDAYSGANGLPNDYGIHMAKAAANDVFGSTNADRWYRDGGLWAYRSTEACPSNGFLRDPQASSLDLDFSTIQTIKPFPAFLRAQHRQAGHSE